MTTSLTTTALGPLVHRIVPNLSFFSAHHILDTCKNMLVSASRKMQWVKWAIHTAKSCARLSSFPWYLYWLFEPSDLFAGVPSITIFHSKHRLLSPHPHPSTHPRPLPSCLRNKSFVAGRNMQRQPSNLWPGEPTCRNGQFDLTCTADHALQSYYPSRIEDYCKNNLFARIDSVMQAVPLSIVHFSTNPVWPGERSTCR